MMKFNVLIVSFWKLIHAKILRTCCVRLVFRKPEILGTVPLFHISLKNYFLIKFYFTDTRWYGIDENHQKSSHQNMWFLWHEIAYYRPPDQNTDFNPSFNGVGIISQFKCDYLQFHAPMVSLHIVIGHFPKLDAIFIIIANSWQWFENIITHFWDWWPLVE